MLKLILCYFGIQLLIILICVSFKVVERRREAKKEKVEFNDYDKY
ncbi:MAG: hypothetical protein ACRCST_05090 [Turicibacter sp.]